MQQLLKKIKFRFAIKKITLIACLNFCVNFGFTQSLIFFDSLDNNVNGQMVIVSGTDLDATHSLHLKSKNMSASNLNVKVKRYESNVLGGTENYFCWTNCYAPVEAGTQPFWVDPYLVSMKPDSMYEKFSAYYIPNGISGTSSFRYVLFDVNNPDDSAYVDIVFDIVTNVKETFSGEQNIHIYPNPNNGRFNLQLKAHENLKMSKIEIYNILGHKVYAEKITEDKSLSLNLPDGIYFCAVLSDNKIIDTKKIIVRESVKNHSQ